MCWMLMQTLHELTPLKFPCGPGHQQSLLNPSARENAYCLGCRLTVSLAGPAVKGWLLSALKQSTPDLRSETGRVGHLGKQELAT